MSNLDFPAKFKSHRLKYRISKPQEVSEAVQPETGMVQRLFSFEKKNFTIPTSFYNTAQFTIKLYESSSSALKKNFFKYGLEMSLVALMIGSIGVNTGIDKKTYQPSDNRYLAYLAEHPEMNEQIINLVNSENIRIHPEKNRLVSAAQASTYDHIVGIVPTNVKHEDSGSPALIQEEGVIIKPNYATLASSQRKDVQEYTVKNGDSIAKIASDFSISIYTILQENKLGENDYIHPGQVLRILPTTGIKHTIASGETLDQISKKYSVDLESVLAFNGIEIPDDIHPGETIIIPDGKVAVPKATASQVASYSHVDVQTASVPGDFTAASGGLIWPLPIHNVTQYYWSQHRALDISDGKRPQFWASQDGIVELSGWQGAYGRTIVINHGNGLKTRYAHASELYVNAGDQVTKGQVIGRVGNTGRVYGATGNHLHYEVMKNGVKVNPLDYTQ